MKILIVDDDAFILQLASKMLEKNGYANVDTAHSGAEALEKIGGTDTPPELVLCDLKMPEMDGLEFARNLVDYQYKGAVIIVSGADRRILDSAEKLLKAHKINVLGQLQKPFNSEDLTALLDTWSPTPADRREASRKTYSPEEIREAIEKKVFINYYQPKVDVATAQVTGMETLVRWDHPEDGLVFPDQFIGVAEENGLIDDIARIVLAGALAAGKMWQDEGRALHLAVNISMDNLKMANFSTFIENEAHAAGIPTKNITLEITESRLMEDHRLAMEVLTRLRLKGFALSIDDFGTGNSTLAKLRDIPFSELKVDRGFVHGACCGDSTINAIYNASLNLAQRLHMTVVAEGVEDAEDWQFLKETGCHMAQGFFIARPMPESAIPEWMASWYERVRNGSV